MGNPRFEGTHASFTADMAPVAPFAGVTISDPGVTNPAERVTFSLQGQGGTVSEGPGYAGPQTLRYTYLPDDPRNSFYSLEGPLAQVTQELDALSFVPNPGPVGTTTSTEFLLMDLSSSGSTSGFSPDASSVVYNQTTSDELNISSQVAYARGAFTLTGHASAALGLTSLEISADVDGVATVLGTAAVAADGSFTFEDQVGRQTQGFITATAGGGAGAGLAATASFSLTGGLGGAYEAEQDVYADDGQTTAAVDRFKADGSQRESLYVPGQTATAARADVFLNGGQPASTFVFDPGYGRDVVSQFRVDGPDHDTLNLKGSDFGNSVAEVLRNTHVQKGGAVITDPTSGDTVKLLGITKAQIAANRGDVVFHA